MKHNILKKKYCQYEYRKLYSTLIQYTERVKRNIFFGVGGQSIVNRHVGRELDKTGAVGQQ